MITEGSDDVISLTSMLLLYLLPLAPSLDIGLAYWSLLGSVVATSGSQQTHCGRTQEFDQSHAKE